jgi:lysophospholipase L1-like esterase
MYDNNSSTSNWFENNPIKSLSLILIISLMIITIIADKIVSLQYSADINPQITRYIRLREYPPLLNIKESIPDNYIKLISDSLSQKKYLLRTDNNGFIIPSKIYDDPDLALVFLGGSTTECLYLEEENRFPYLVGRLIQKDLGLKINSYNSARSGNNTLHSIDILLNKIIPIEPDVIIMMHNINDISILLHEKTYWNKNIHRSPLVEVPEAKNFREFFKTIKNLIIPYLYIYFGDMIKPLDEFEACRGEKIIIDKEKLNKEFTTNLEVFISICRAKNMIPVLMTMQSRFKDNPDPFILNAMKTMEASGISYKEFKSIFDMFNQSIRQLGELRNVSIIDLAKIVPQEKEYIYDEVHFNDNGSKFGATIIKDALEPIITPLVKKTKNN